MPEPLSREPAGSGSAWWPTPTSRGPQGAVDAGLRGVRRLRRDPARRRRLRAGRRRSLNEIAPIWVARGNGDDGSGGRPTTPDDPAWPTPGASSWPACASGLTHVMPVPEMPPHWTVATACQRYFPTGPARRRHLRRHARRGRQRRRRGALRAVRRHSAPARNQHPPGAWRQRRRHAPHDRRSGARAGRGRRRARHRGRACARPRHSEPVVRRDDVRSAHAGDGDLRFDRERGPGQFSPRTPSLKARSCGALKN